MSNLHDQQRDNEIDTVEREYERHESAPLKPTVEHVADKNEIQEKRTPLPKVQIGIIMLIQFAEPITALVIYPFINQFVRDTGITQGDSRKTGYYAGIIESAFFVTEAATVFHWGWLSDRIGRRPVLLLGPLGLTFAMLRFGYSTDFWSMVWSRSLQGVFNGNIGVGKTAIVELTDSTNIGDAFAMMPLMWSAGATTAPLIGGIFSNPATRWPTVFGKIALFKKHPYLLPCMIASSLAFCSFVIASLCFKETSSAILDKQKENRRKHDPESSEASSTHTLLNDAHAADYGATSQINLPTSPTPSVSSADSRQKLASDAEIEPPTLRTVLASRSLQFLILNYMFLTFVDMCYSVLLPLIYSTPIEFGGLGLTPFAIGAIMGTFGFLNAIIQINFLGQFIRKYGAIRVYSSAFACFVVCFLTLPMSTYLTRRNGGVGFAAGASIFVQYLFQLGLYMAYGSIHVVVAETTPKPVLGAVNGLVQMVGCTLRSVAPTFASSLFSISLQRHLVGGYFVYIVMMFFVICGVICTTYLPKHKPSRFGTTTPSH